MPFEMKMPEKIVGTDEQEAIWKAMKEHDCNLVVEALAGTGKTFTMVEGLKKLEGYISKNRVGFMAFNRSVADELYRKVPRSVWTGTSHSLGYRILRDNLDIVDVVEDKTWDIINELKEEFGIRSWRKGQRPAIRMLSSMLKQLGYRPGPTPDYVTMEDCCVKYDIRWPGNVAQLYDYAHTVLQTCMKRTEAVDFDDQIWLPYVLDMETEFDLLCVDEAQDQNKVQQELAFRCGKRIIVVGDTYQSIYGFRGADTESMSNFLQRLGEADRGVWTYPLTTCWRCGEDIIKIAQRMVPDIQAKPGAHKGRVEIVNGDNNYRTYKAGDMILCRTNVHLIQMVYRLWSDGRKAYVQGRDVAAGLRRMVERFEDESQELSLPAMNRWVDYYEMSEREKLVERNSSSSQIASLEDRCDCIRVIIDNSPMSNHGDQDIDSLKKRLKFLFEGSGDPKKQVRLSSVHRAKGLESNRVVILEPGLMPHYMARPGWEMDQERNIAYVACTRAIETLQLNDGTSPYFGDGPTRVPERPQTTLNRIGNAERMLEEWDSDQRARDLLGLDDEES